MIIIHGEDLIKSRFQLLSLINQQKEQGREVRHLIGQGLTLTAVIQSLESPSFFGPEKAVVIEGLLIRKDKEVKKIIDYLSQNSSLQDLIWWEGKTLTPAILKKFAQASLHYYKINPLIFKFLDSLRPGNALNTLELFHNILRTDKPEQVFYMLVRQSRLLIQAADKKSQSSLKMAPWQKQKLISQAGFFSVKKLISLHRQLLKIDYEQKTGQDPYPLKSRLDLFVANL